MIDKARIEAIHKDLSDAFTDQWVAHAERGHRRGEDIFAVQDRVHAFLADVERLVEQVADLKATWEAAVTACDRVLLRVGCENLPQGWWGEANQGLHASSEAIKSLGEPEPEPL